jgi:hypothetical protein
MAQLRDDIDSGRTGDKVAATDHAAAPLGTDEEAAGTPVDPRIIAEVRQYECNRTANKSAISRPWTFWAVFVLVAGLIAAGILYSIS